MSQSIPFTGERFAPECQREIWYEHWHRYAFACQFVEGARVLDVACGEGYGAALLSRYAAQVIGIDLSAEAIAHATRRYGGRPALQYAVGRCERIPVRTASIDVAVSFETIEHIAPQCDLIAELRRVLAPHGVLILSSPNKKTYSDDRGYSNEFHVRELYLEELLDLVRGQFPATALLGQKLLFQSALWRVSEPVERVGLTLGEGAEMTWATTVPYEPMYFVLLCAQEATHLPPLAQDLWLFGDQSESVYRHYDETVRQAMRLDELLREREEGNDGRALRITELERMVEERDSLLASAREQREELQQLAEERARMLELRTQQFAELEAMIEERDRRIAQLEAMIEERDRRIAQLEARFPQRQIAWLRRKLRQRLGGRAGP